MGLVIYLGIFFGETMEYVFGFWGAVVAATLVYSVMTNRSNQTTLRALISSQTKANDEIASLGQQFAIFLEKASAQEDMAKEVRNFMKEQIEHKHQVEIKMMFLYNYFGNVRDAISKISDKTGVYASFIHQDDNPFINKK